MFACKPAACPAFSTVRANYAYDPLGRRTQKSGAGVTQTFFLNDGSDEIAEYDASGDVLRRFVPGPAVNEPIVYENCTGATQPNCTGTGPSLEYYHTDHHGTVVATSGAAGALIEGPFTYDANRNGGSLSGEPFQYVGMYLDAETRLYYDRARYYSPALGRFMQTDPIGYKDDLDLYTYVRNDPVDMTDPTGLSCQTGSHIPGNAQGCSSSNGDDEAGAQENKVVNENTQKAHPKEYKAMTDAYQRHFGKAFDPHSARAHVSETSDDTCAKSSSCTRGSVYAGLTHCPATACYPSAIRSGAITVASPVGAIQTELDPRNYWLMNITLGPWS